MSHADALRSSRSACETYGRAIDRFLEGGGVIPRQP